MLFEVNFEMPISLFFFNDIIPCDNGLKMQRTFMNEISLEFFLHFQHLYTI